MTNLLTHDNPTVQALLSNPVFQRAAEENNWLVYRLEQRPGKKPAKLPVNPETNHIYSKDEAAQWTLDDAMAMASKKKNHGIGYLPRKGSALVGVDIDECVEDGEIDGYADNMIGNAYTEFSPSGTGLRCLLPRKKGDDWFREPGGSNPLGFFGSEGRFFTVTFDCIWEPEDTTLEDDGVMRRFIKQHLGATDDANPKAAALARAKKTAKKGNDRKHWFNGLEREEQIGCMIEVLEQFDPEPDETWYRVGMALKTLDTDWSWELFDAWSKGAPNYDLAENEKRWRSFKSDGELTYRSLFKEAREAGWNEGAWRDPVSFDKIEGQLFETFDPGSIKPDQPWLLEGWLRAHGNAGFAGMSGVGKTTLSGTWIACMIAGKMEIVGLPPVNRPLNVAWLNAEEESSTLQHQVNAALIEFGLTKRGTLLTAGTEALDVSDDGLSLVVKKRNVEEHYTDLVVNEALVDKIVEAMKEAEIDIMIIDPITEFNDGNENDRGDAKKLNRAITLIAQRSGAASIIWAHTGQMPEGKKPDWYKDDLYSQRGSSQNVGALKTFGTLTPLMPVGINKSDDARKWYASVKTGNNPNVIHLKQLKVKNYPTLNSLHYKLQPSAHNKDYAVAVLMAADEAQNTVNGTFDAARNTMLLKLSQDMVKAMGTGVHQRHTVNKRMGGNESWVKLLAKDVKANTKKHRDVLMMWEGGIIVKVKDQAHRVAVELGEKEAFSVLIEEV